MDIERKCFQSEVKSFDDKNLIIEHFISTITRDSGGDVMEPDGMKVRGKAVVLFQHGQDPAKGSEPIAKPLSFSVGLNKDGKKGIIARRTQYFDGRNLTPPDNTGERLYQKAKDGFMPNWSVGWMPIKCEPLPNGGRHVLEWELHEYSQVAVGMNEEATTDWKSLPLVKYAIEEAEQKSVIPYAEHTRDPEEAAWDGAKEKAAADTKDLKVMCAWYDSENPELKSSYKLPHHRAVGYHTVWAGVRAAMGALMGARGGVDIPAGDKQAVYTHLRKHYEAFDKTAPEMKEYTEVELKEMFPEEKEKIILDFKEFKSIAEGLVGQLPYDAMQTITGAMFQELFSQTYSNPDMTEQEICDSILLEYYSLVSPFMAQFIKELRLAQSQNKTLEEIKKTYTETKEPEAIPVPSESVSVLKIVPPPAEKNIKISPEKSLKMVAEKQPETIKLPCTIEELKAVLNKSVSDIVIREIRKLKGKVD